MVFQCGKLDNFDKKAIVPINYWSRKRSYYLEKKYKSIYNKVIALSRFLKGNNLKLKLRRGIVKML